MALSIGYAVGETKGQGSVVSSRRETRSEKERKSRARTNCSLIGRILNAPTRAQSPVYFSAHPKSPALSVEQRKSVQLLIPEERRGGRRGLTDDADETKLAICWTSEPDLPQLFRVLPHAVYSTEGRRVSSRETRNQGDRRRGEDGRKGRTSSLDFTSPEDDDVCSCSFPSSIYSFHSLIPVVPDSTRRGIDPQLLEDSA